MQKDEHWEWDERIDVDGNPCEAVAVFDSEADLELAAEDLEIHGFNHAAMSRSASPEVIEEKLGHKVQSVQELEDDSAVPREDIIDHHSKFEGRMVAMLAPAYAFGLFGLAYAVSQNMQTLEIVFMAGLLAMAGAGLGALYVRRSLKTEENRNLADALIGGKILWVRIGNKMQAMKAREILHAHAGKHVHIHGPQT